MGRDPKRDSVRTEHDELSVPPSEGRSTVSRPAPARMPEIPRAPAVPDFGPPSSALPSYAPEALAPTPQYEHTLELDSDARDTLRHVSPEHFGLTDAPTRPIERDAAKTHRSPPPALDDAERRLWDPAELELLDGKRQLVIERFERAADRSVQSLAGDGGVEELPMLATLAAGFFTMAPIFRHFAPFDLSLFSMARVEAALDVVYGKSPRPDVASEPGSASLLLGAYLGECLRQAYGGEWHGKTAASDETSVAAVGRSWHPFRAVGARLGRVTPLRFEPPGALHPGAEPYAQRLSIPLVPPAPWDPDAWPEPALVPRLGLALGDSIVGLYCAELGRGPLDRSLTSLTPLDDYVSLLAPRDAPRAGDTPWVRRAAVLVGAYVGEVLCHAAGARWAPPVTAVPGPERYTLLLPDRSTATPVLAVYDRLRGVRQQSLREYAAGVQGVM